MQFFLLFSYFMDGFAYAGEALCGKAFGANNRDAFRNITRRLFVWGGSIALMTAMVYYCLGTPILELLTDTPEVVRCATEYLPLVALIPLVSFPAFLFDGIFIGMSFTSGMLRALIVATVIFFALHFLTSQLWGNTALWMAFLAYLGTRGIVQAIALRRKF